MRDRATANWKKAPGRTEISGLVDVAQKMSSVELEKNWGFRSDTKYIYLRNHLIAEVGGAGTQYIHTDGLGSPVARTNTAKEIVSRTRYEPYGNTAAGAAPTIGFTGHANDVDTGAVEEVG